MTDRVAPSPLGLSLVLPCFNEVKTLPIVVPPLVRAVEALGITWEMILVDNGSTDGTHAAIVRLQEEHRVVRSVSVFPNQGYGGGVLAGLDAASGTLVAYTWADGQVPPDDVAQVLQAALAMPRRTLVKARRARRSDSLLRRTVSRGYNLLFRLCLPVRSSDINATPKVLHRDDLDALDLKARDWFLDAECMIRAGEQGFSIVEVPIDFVRRVAGRSHVRPGAVIEFLHNLWDYKTGRRS